MTTLYGPPASSGPKPQQAGAAYTVEDTGLSGFGLNSSALEVRPAINASGQVAGPAPVSGLWHAFRTNAALTQKTDLGVLPGGDRSTAEGINDDGAVAGYSTTGFDPPNTEGEEHAVRWTPGEAPRDLGSFGFLNFSRGRAINNDGEVVGEALDNGDRQRAVRFTDTRGLETIEIPGDPLLAAARGINAADDTVGFFTQSEAGSSAFRMTAGGAFTDFGPQSGGSAAIAINNNRVAAGVAQFSPGVPRAALFTAGSATVHLGTLPDDRYSEAFGINDAGTVVGGSGVSPDVPSHRAFIYTAAAGMRDLNALIAPGSGWVLSYATGINARGQIVGFGSHNEVPAIFRLTPRQTGTGRLRVSPTTLAFGMVRIGARRQRGFTVKNTGTAPLSVVALVPDAQFAGVSGEGSFQLAAGAEHRVVVQFVPDQRAKYRGTAIVTSDDPSRRVVNVKLTGSGCGKAHRAPAP